MSISVLHWQSTISALVMDTKIKEEIIVYLEAGMAYTYKYHGLLDYITCIACLHVPWKPNLVLFALH